MRALVALLLSLLLAALVSACDTTEPAAEADCGVLSAVEAGRLAACLSGAVDLAVDAEVDAFVVDEAGGRVVLDVRGTDAGGFVILNTGPDPAPGVYSISGLPPDESFVGAVVLTVDVPGTFDTFNGRSGTVTVESAGADGALVGRLDVAAGGRTGDLRIEGRFRTGPLPS